MQFEKRKEKRVTAATSRTIGIKAVGNSRVLINLCTLQLNDSIVVGNTVTKTVSTETAVESNSAVRQLIQPATGAQHHLLFAQRVDFAARTATVGTGSPGRPQRAYRLLGTGSPGRPQRP